MKNNILVLLVAIQIFVNSAFAQQIKKRNMENSSNSIPKADGPIVRIGTRSENLRLIYNEKDPLKKEKLFEIWIKNFPPQKADSADRKQYDYARNAVAGAYAKADNIKKALQYTYMLETPTWKGQGYAQIADIFQEKEYLAEATVLYKIALENSYKYVNANDYTPAVQIAASFYPMFSMRLSKLYIKQKKNDEALLVLEKLFKHSESKDGELYETYASLLMQVGQDQKAFTVLDQAAKLGVANESMKNDLKKMYIKLKGSDAGYDEYLSKINKTMKENIKNEVAKTMVNIPAANFTLKNLEEKAVSLADLKGKTVILDFWATWCGPCKSSFPLMKTAMDRFKDDPNVRFLFIHTFEKDTDASIQAKNYITEHYYPFEVLMDLKNADGDNAVAKSFGVGGIPNKIIIDGNGNIRFSVVGFSGGQEAAVEEIAAMIELSKKGI